ncbi:acyltransferase family protein [Lactobacillus selangorensis]|uniref:Acyltransferase family protein n=1 Tax=Lactobacillus selangorensis TaxID=81857 RepID=A0A0R2FZW4_9LACO|nr:acyltransferase family protein [Lactobacillus selangorensis]KRN29420.1 acyltransferase family protein [Lactobacillus selangorensis]KRN34051.1 acyltransferase family protein [Lactobacillus selangorensis]
MSKRLKRARYISGFDGLRTVGVIGVILYHLMPETFKGGYLGVPIFMVLSGYLITDHLLLEHEQYGRIDMKQFTLRRIKRLYPALVAMLLATSAYITLFQRNLLHNLYQIVVSNMVYLYNWWQIGHGQSYFERFANNESPFTHLWTLSIDGQFYLIWPLLVMVMMMLFKRNGKRHAFRVTVLLALLSAGWMAYLFQPGADPSRIYYGTDTRAFSLLIGAALAFIWPSADLNPNIKASNRFTLDGIGMLTLIGLIILFMNLNAQGTLVYRGGMFLFSVLVALMVAIVVHPGADWNRVWSNRFFKWVSSRSYGIYIYQFPVMIFFEDAFPNVADHPVLYPVIEVLIICAISEFSFRFIEQPLAHFDYQQVKQHLLHGNSWHRLYVTAMGLICVVGMIGIVTSPTKKASAANNSALAQNIKANSKRNDAKKEALLKKAKEQKKAAKNSSASSSQKPAKVDKKLEQDGLTQQQLQQAQTMQVTAVGDSVMLDGSDALQKIFPQMLVDAAVSRHLEDATGIIQSYANQGVLAQTVLIGMGTNGAFNMEQLDKLMHLIGPSRQVYWINVRVPTRQWQDPVNNTLRQADRKYGNLHVIDWYDYSNAHQDWFYSDQVHPTPAGAKHYAAYIAAEMLKK